MTVTMQPRFIATLSLSACLLSGCVAPAQLLANVAAGQQVPVTAADAGRYDSVCHLRTQRAGLGGDGGTGSAVLYRGRYLITAAHNVSSPFYNRVTSIAVHCGKRDTTTATPDFTLTNGEWATARGYWWTRYSRDVGVIRLPRPLASTQTVELAVALPPAGAMVEIAGYPGRGIGPATNPGSILYAGSGAVTLTNRRGQMAYAINTTTGNSGGPVWVRDGNRIQLVGIHVVGLGTQSGGARRVDGWFRSEVERMIGVLDARAAGE